MKHAVGKKMNKKGFTLAELLIVVAIIAILVAIMVPVFGTSRANAIHAKDLANVRSAYSEAVTNALAANNYVAADGDLEVVLTVTKKAKTGSEKEPHATTTIDSTSELTYNQSDNKIVVKTTGAKPETTDIMVDEDITLVPQGDGFDTKGSGGSDDEGGGGGGGAG